MHADVRDFKGYYITRFGPDGTKTILPSPNASHDPYFEYSWLADTSIQANQVYAYEITAVDWAGKRSAPTRIEPQYVVAAPVFDPPGNQSFSAPVNVTMRCTTVGAEIRYTLDGTDPKDNPSAQTYIFGNPLLFSTTTKLTARAKVGNVWSELTSAVFNIVKPKCSTPVFSPISGTYPIGTKITILCDNPTDASIKYRIDNDIWLGPVTSGSQITIPSGTHTLIAYALKPGFEDSDQTPPAKYTFSPTAIGEIKFNPDGGNYASPQVVKIICETSGVEIRYAFNRDPVSTDYLVPNGGTVLIDNTCALRARAWKDGISSDVKSAFYQIQQNNATVSFDPDGGEFLEPRGVQIRCSDPKLYVYYTIDGRDPTDKDNDGCGLGGAYVYVDRSLTLKARAYKGITPSVIKSATYMVDTKKVAMPVFTPSDEGGGCISSEQFVSMSCSTPGAVIHYAMEFRDPTENDPVYTGPIRITQSPQNISARAFKAGYRPSDTKFGLYHLKLTPPVLTPDGGVYRDPLYVTIDKPSDDHFIKFTTDGSDPVSNGQIYTAPIYIDRTTVLRAAWFKGVGCWSDIKSAVYVLDPNKVATPIFNPPGGVYRESQVVTITTETPGARIHYKIARIEDTSEPTEADPLYTEPIVVDKSCTIRAKAFRDGAPPSSSASADYSLNVLYVSKSGSDQNSGLSWTNAFATIGKALSIAQPGSEVWVAKGTYYECVTLKPGVGLYGGFIGNETRRGDRPHFPRPNPDNNATTLTFVDDSVVYCLSGAGPDTILDGFVIENGFSEKSDPSQGFGGGVYISRSSPTVSHNTIRNCGAYWGGGGIAAMWESSAPVIFANVIENNTAFQGGGIIAFEGASPKIISNFIRGNTADAIPRPPYYSQGGGGLFISGNSKALIASNLITYNSTNYFRGGGICCENGSGIPVIVNNTVSYNSAPDCAGGIYGGAIKNCIVFNNNASSGKDKDVYSDWPGPNIVGSNPGLNANYEPFCDSTCVDKGDDSVISTVFADFCGMPRLMGSHVDIGAYEAKKVSDVVLNPSGGFYSAPLSVTMTCSTEGSTIHYTINGQEPTENDPVYLGPIRVDQDTVVRARAFLPGACPSEVTEGNYEIPGIVQAPTMSPPGGTYVGYKDVMITCETPGAVIHYTMDGRDPTESDPIITSGSSLRISASTIVKAKAWRNNWIPSETTVASFEILYQVAPPRSTPVGGRYSKPQLVTLSCSTPGATIKYTLDDTDPASSPTAMKYVPGHPILIPNGVTTLTAKAFRDEWLDSPSLRQVYIVGINRELAIAYLQSAQMPDGSLSGGYPVMLALKLLGSDVSK